MKYNRPQATASWGMMAKDWERGIDYNRLYKERLSRAQQAIRHAGLGGVIAFNFDNIGYSAATNLVNGRVTNSCAMPCALLRARHFCGTRHPLRSACRRHGSPIMSQPRSLRCTADCTHR